MTGLTYEELFVLLMELVHKVSVHLAVGL